MQAHINKYGNGLQIGKITPHFFMIFLLIFLNVLFRMSGKELAISTRFETSNAAASTGFYTKSTHLILQL
jgi:hypothetical protein